MSLSVNVGPAWTQLRDGDAVQINDLIRNAPEPPFAVTDGRRPVDYCRSCSANLLYLEQQLPDATWRDPHNRLFEAKAYRFLSKIRDSAPGEYELNWPFKLKPDDFQLQVFTHARMLREIALAPAALGTGKTKMALDIAADKFMRGEIQGVIVIAPNGVHRQWIQEAIPQHMTDSVPVITHIWKPTKKVAKAFPLNPNESLKRLRVMTFNVEAFSASAGKAMKAARALMQTGRWLLVMDESTRIKNGRAMRTRVIVKYLGPLAACRMILTGTPVTKGLEDFYSQYDFLNPGIIGLSSWTAFRNRYCVTIPAYRGAALGAVRVIGYKNQEELFRKMAPVTFMIGAEVLGLGEPIRLRREVSMTAEQESIYNALAERLYADLIAQRISTPQNTLVELLRLQQVLCGWVYETAVDEEGLEKAVGRRIESRRLNVLRQVLDDTDEQVLTWARFTNDIDDICGMLEIQDAAAIKEGSPRRWRHARYDGVVKAAVRDEGKGQFRDGEIEYMVGNPAAGGTGVDGLQENCSLAVYYSNSFNREHRWQSEGRLYRRGQKAVGRVRFLDLVVPDTVDELFLQAYESTEELAKMVMTSPDMLRGGRR
jgi:superfamily II DNA or RNA helicase